MANIDLKKPWVVVEATDTYIIREKELEERGFSDTIATLSKVDDSNLVAAKMIAASNLMLETLQIIEREIAAYPELAAQHKSVKRAIRIATK